MKTQFGLFYLERGKYVGPYQGFLYPNVKRAEEDAVEFNLDSERPTKKKFVVLQQMWVDPRKVTVV